MFETNETIWCAGCGAEIFFTPYVVEQQLYCCQDCAQGFPCECGRAIEREEDFRDADLPIESIYPGS